MSTRTHPKGTTTMATRNPTTTTDAPTTQPTLAAFADADRAAAIRRYRSGDMLWEIADALESDCETVARDLRQAGVLKPYDDPRALAHLYHDHDHTLAELAALFDYARGPESIRFRMEKYGIDRGYTPSQTLDELNPEDLGLSPMQTDDSDTKFSKRGGA